MLSSSSRERWQSSLLFYLGEQEEEDKAHASFSRERLQSPLLCSLEDEKEQGGGQCSLPRLEKGGKTLSSSL